MRGLCTLLLLFVSATCCSQISSPFTTYRHVADHNMSTMSAVHCSSVVLVGPSSKIVFGDGTVQTTAAGGGVNAMQNPSTGTLNMNGYGIAGLAYLKADEAYGGKSISFSNSPSGIVFDERLRPFVDSTYDIGSPSFRWRDIYVSSVNADGITTAGIMTDALVYPRNADYPIFAMIGNTFRIAQPFPATALQIGGTSADGVIVKGPFYAGQSREPINLGNFVISDNKFYPIGTEKNIGLPGFLFAGVYASSFTSPYFTVSSTGTRVYVPLTSSHVVIADINGVPQFSIHYSTMESSAIKGLVISTGGVLGDNVRGVFVDRGTDNPEYAGNVIIGELSANSFIRPTVGRLNVKGPLFVTSGYNGEDICISNSSSGNYIQAGNTLVIQARNAVLMTGESSGIVYLSTSITGSGSYSLLRYNTSNGRLYYDTSTRRSKRNIRNYSVPRSALKGLSIRKFTEVSTGRESIGLIAEELHEAGLTDVVVYDDAGKIVGVAYEKIPLLLIPVLQEQQARIERLERAVVAITSGTFATEFPEGFPVNKPTSEQGGAALNILAILAAALTGAAAGIIGKKTLRE